MSTDGFPCGDAVGFGGPSPSRPLADIRAGCLAGNGRDCHGLADMIRRGEVAAWDEGAAAGLFAYGCEFGSMESCGTLGRSYEAGDGVPKDASAARALFDLACAGGLIEACADAARLRRIGPTCPEAIEGEDPRGTKGGPTS